MNTQSKTSAINSENLLINHLDHLCSAGEENFLLQPWTDCITRHAVIRQRNDKSDGRKLTIN